MFICLIPRPQGKYPRLHPAPQFWTAPHQASECPLIELEQGSVGERADLYPPRGTGQNGDVSEHLTGTQLVGSASG